MYNVRDIIQKSPAQLKEIYEMIPLGYLVQLK